MDEGENILQRWNFLRSYGYDLVGRSGLVFFVSGRLTVALRRPCRPSSTSKGPGVLNQGDSPLHEHTCVRARAARCSPYLYPPHPPSSQSLPKKRQIKGCDSRLEEHPEPGIKTHSILIIENKHTQPHGQEILYSEGTIKKKEI